MSQEPMSDEQFMDTLDKLQNIVDSLQSKIFPKLDPEADKSPNFNLAQNFEPKIEVIRNIQKEYLENVESSIAWEIKLSPEEEKSLIFNPDLSIKMEQCIHSNLQSYKLSAWDTVSSSKAEEGLNSNLVRSTGLEQRIFPNLQISTNIQGGMLGELSAGNVCIM